MNNPLLPELPLPLREGVTQSNFATYRPPPIATPSSTSDQQRDQGLDRFCVFSLMYLCKVKIHHVACASNVWLALDKHYYEEALCQSMDANGVLSVTKES